jgi:hypothetical protein
MKYTAARRTPVIIEDPYIFVSPKNIALVFELRPKGDKNEQFFFFYDLTTRELDIIKRCVLDQGGSLSEINLYPANKEVKAIVRQKRIQQYLRERAAIPNDIVFIYTGGKGNKDPERSLGGEWGEQCGDLLVTPLEKILPIEKIISSNGPYKPGSTIYRAIGVKNISKRILYYVEAKFVHYDIEEIELENIGQQYLGPIRLLRCGWANEPVNTPPAPIPNEHQAPRGILWNKLDKVVTLPEKHLRPGEVKGLWLKAIVPKTKRDLWDYARIKLRISYGIPAEEAYKEVSINAQMD